MGFSRFRINLRAGNPRPSESFTISSCGIEIGFLAFASGTMPIIRQFAERGSRWYPLRGIALLRIIDESAHPADIFPGRRTVYYLSDRFRPRRIIQIDHLHIFQILISKRRMGREIDSRMIPDECTYIIRRRIPFNGLNEDQRM